LAALGVSSGAQDGVNGMWGCKPKDAAAADVQSSSPLKEAIHQARVEAAERTNVIVDLRDAELARLELLDEALNPLFAEVPPEIDLFDRGISRGETPRLWIDGAPRTRGISRNPRCAGGGYHLRGAPARRAAARA
jgi:hypothetical protein